MDYYLRSKPQNKPFLHTRSQEKASLALVGRSCRSRGRVGPRPRAGPDRAPRPGAPRERLRFEALVCGAISTNFLHSGERYQGSHIF